MFSDCVVVGVSGIVYGIPSACQAIWEANTAIPLISYDPLSMQKKKNRVKWNFKIDFREIKKKFSNLNVLCVYVLSRKKKSKIAFIIIVNHVLKDTKIYYYELI